MAFTAQSTVAVPSVTIHLPGECGRRGSPGRPGLPVPTLSPPDSPAEVPAVATRPESEREPAVASNRISDFLSRHLDLEPHERGVFALLAALVTVLLGGYTVAKVARDSMFLSEYGAVSLPYGYIATALASVFFVWLEPRIVRRISRVGVMAGSQLFAIAASVAAALLFPLEKHWLAGAYYVWAGSQGMMGLAHFWVLALEVWDTRRARRLFPLLAGFGLLGGVAGGFFAKWAASQIGLDGLLWTVAGTLLVARGLTAFLGSRRVERPLAAQMEVASSRWRMIAGSPFLQRLALALVISVVVATLVDFQFKFLAEQAYPDRRELAGFLGGFYAALNGLALVAQFGIAGWILRRMGLGPATALQPVSVLGFSMGMMLAPQWWLVTAMRWTQGVIFQTLGKSSAEIYYLAIRPPERRRIKPAIDTLTERGADALVGLLLLATFQVLGVNLVVIAVLTFVVAAVWLVVLARLNREYVRAFRESLATSWSDPDMAAETLRFSPARKALIQALASDDERSLVVALRLCRQVRSPDLARRVRRCLEHPTSRVRAEALRALVRLRARGATEQARAFLASDDEDLRQAAVEYLLTYGSDPQGFALELLRGNEPALRSYALQVLAGMPALARGVLNLEWVDRLLAGDAEEDLVAAAHALSVLREPGALDRVRRLLGHPNPEVVRAALRAAARHRSPDLLDYLAALLVRPPFSYEAREALAALGNAAVPKLEAMLASKDADMRVAAASALARIRTRRAVAILRRLARDSDPESRGLGLRKLNRLRMDTGLPVLPRTLVHKMFLRELGEVRGYHEPALGLQTRSEPELQLLGRSFRESADLALERACRALGCWYDAPPLIGVYEGLRIGQGERAAQALEYLGHVLPGSTFKPVRELFEERRPEEEAAPLSDRENLGLWVRSAWQSGDAWLRACALRAARVITGIDLAEFTPGPEDDTLVQLEWAAVQAGTAGR